MPDKLPIALHVHGDGMMHKHAGTGEALLNGLSHQKDLFKDVIRSDSGQWATFTRGGTIHEIYEQFAGQNRHVVGIHFGMSFLEELRSILPITYSTMQLPMAMVQSQKENLSDIQWMDNAVAAGASRYRLEEDISLSGNYLVPLAVGCAHGSIGDRPVQCSHGWSTKEKK